MVAGRPPYGLDSPAHVMARLLRDEPVPLRQIDRRIPRDLETICLKMLHKSPAGRYPTLSAVLEDLRRFEAGEPLLARRPSVIAKAGRWLRRRWAIVAVAAALAIPAIAVPIVMSQRSYTELMAWGDEEFSKGNSTLAAQVFVRALEAPGNPDPREAAQRIVTVIRDMTDSKQAVELALRVLDVAPDASFGKHDYLVAKACVAEARAKSPTGFIEANHHGPTTNIDRAARRLSLFLEGPYGSATERADAEQSLDALEQAIRPLQPLAGFSADELVRLPQGTVPELTRLAIDPARPLWERAKASLALARLHDAAKDEPAARASYASAFELMRKVYPYVSGVSSDLQAHGSAAAQAPETRLVKEVLDARRRLNPEANDPARGGIRLTVQGEESLPDMSFTVNLELCDPSVSSPDQGLPRNFGRHIALDPAKPVFVGVIDGAYRMKVRSTGHTPATNGTQQQVAIDTSAFPNRIEIQGQALDLPPIVVRRLQDIALHVPRGKTLDLQADTLDWTSVPGAVAYSVQLSTLSEIPVPTRTSFHTVRVEQPLLAFSRLAPQDLRSIARNWTAGQHVSWHVTAMDAQERVIGRSANEARAVITRGLDSP